MKIPKTIGKMLSAISILMLVTAPILSPSSAEARRGVAACGPRGCGAAACGPRGCAAVGRRAGPAYRPAYRPSVRPARRGVMVVAPRRYWRPGAAIAAGAAIGFVAGAAAGMRQGIQRLASGPGIAGHVRRLTPTAVGVLTLTSFVQAETSVLLCARIR